MLWDQEKKTPSYQRIIFWVLAIHFIFIALLHFKNTVKDAYLKPKLIVKNFLEKSIAIKDTVKGKKKAEVFSVAAAKPENKSSDGLWNQKREEFFKEKLDSFSQIKKAKEQAQKQEKEKAESLVQADRQLREQRQKKQVLNKRSLEKKTSQKVLKKKSAVIAIKSGKKSSLKNEVLRKKRVEQLQRLRESLVKLESFQKTQTQKHKNNNKQSKNFSSSLKPLVVPKLKKGSWTASLISDSSSDFFVSQGEEDNFRALFLNYLKEQLQLPEIGEVKLKIALNPEGRVVKIEVLMAKNQENKAYLEEVLPTLSFPFLKNYLKKEKSFMITFLNEEQD